MKYTEIIYNPCRNDKFFKITSFKKKGGGVLHKYSFK